MAALLVESTLEEFGEVFLDSLAEGETVETAEYFVFFIMAFLAFVIVVKLKNQVFLHHVVLRMFGEASLRLE